MSRVVVTGGAGFVPSHVCERLLADGDEVVCVDSLITGTDDNLATFVDRDGFEFQQCDVSESLEVEGPIDLIMHMASPASPVDYYRYPIETMLVGSQGTHNALRLAQRKDATFFYSSTSEVYGDPLVHPQTEEYWGNVNPIGPRSVYDEAKRFSEAMAASFEREFDTEVRIARIFNTHGPRMRAHDGRAVPSFIQQALQGKPLTVHGDGSQTRSLCYVDDLVDGIVRLARSDVQGPVNLGNPREVTVLQIAELVRSLIGTDSEIVFVERPIDDPERRRPDIGKAQRTLGWEPRIDFEDGLARTVEWATSAWS
ncbi:MAG: SDR family oxidoreductase [Actinomycetota bacterium]|nr:SDR family oxidoreductase [Actinomycetota bacterium]